MTADLVAFLRARLDEAEQAANAAASEVGPDWYYNPGRGCVASRHEQDLVATGSQDHLERERGAHIAHHDPANVLREIKAQRALVDGLADVIGGQYIDDGEPVLAEWVLRMLVASHADHPDYLAEWTPEA